MALDIKQINARSKLIHMLSKMFKTVGASETHGCSSDHKQTTARPHPSQGKGVVALELHGQSPITGGKERHFQQPVTQKIHYSYTFSCIKPKNSPNRNLCQNAETKKERAYYTIHTYIPCVTRISDKQRNQ